MLMLDKSKSKIKIKKNIFSKKKDEPFTWKDIKHLELEDDDEVRAEYVDGYVSENESYDEHFACEIFRMVEETDSQFEKRQKRIEDDNIRDKKRRMETYERLKAEFEPKTPN